MRNAEQFKYGQFEVFVPVTAIDLPTTCAKYYILRMPQTMDSNQKAELQREQQLYFDIARVVKDKVGTVRVVLYKKKTRRL